MTNEKSCVYSVVDLFAGAGGLSYGFTQTGRFIVKAAFENNAHAQKTYKENHPETVLYGDIHDADYPELIKKFGDIDVVIGGPPCQGFSNANRQKNHAISQNNILVKQFVRAVVNLNPKAFIMENVGALRSDIHRFFVDKSDESDLSAYAIPTEPAEIMLLEEEYVFEKAIHIVSNPDLITKYIWAENDYRSINLIYRMRNNATKRIQALKKHKNKLLRLADRLLQAHDDGDYIIHQNHRVANALREYFDGPECADIVSELAPAVMIQRMLGKARELHENEILVDHFSISPHLVAHVKAMTVLNYIECVLLPEYHIDKDILRAVEFGIPQKRERFILMGIRKSAGTEAILPKGSFSTDYYRTVRDAIGDLEDIPVGYDVVDDNGIELSASLVETSVLGRQLRNTQILYNHIATESSEIAIKRFEALRQGENFHDLAPSLKGTYSNADRTQNTIYLRLKYDEPSGTVVNVRKSMWIHPVLDRALSIREAARLQTFPDSFVFFGTKDAQYQQIGNAVPPLLAKEIAFQLARFLDEGNDAQNKG